MMDPEPVTTLSAFSRDHHTQPVWETAKAAEIVPLAPVAALVAD